MLLWLQGDPYFLKSAKSKLYLLLRNVAVAAERSITFLRVLGGERLGMLLRVVAVIFKKKVPISLQRCCKKNAGNTSAVTLTCFRYLCCGCMEKHNVSGLVGGGAFAPARHTHRQK